MITYSGISTLTKDGNDSTAYVYDTAGKLVFFYTDVEVNKYGKIISMKSLKPDRTRLQTIVNIYKEQTWVGGSVRDSSGREIFSTLIKLNEKHDPSELVQTQAVDGKSLITRTQYVYDQFDKHGNWIRRQELNEESGACKIVIREIRYRKS